MCLCVIEYFLFSKLRFFSFYPSGLWTPPRSKKEKRDPGQEKCVRRRDRHIENVNKFHSRCGSRFGCDDFFGKTFSLGTFVYLALYVRV